MIEEKLREKIKEAEQDLHDYLRDTGKIKKEVETLLEVKKRVVSKKIAPKYETGIHFFDFKTGGFAEGSFVNIAGENFSGKTFFVMKILANISKYNKVLFFSFEMYENILIRNRCKQYTEEQLKNTYIEQKANNLDEIIDIIKNKAEEGVKFIVIDSRMKVEVTGKMEEYQKNSLISRRLSKLTQELGVIILLVNQISEADLRTKRPSLKGSGDQAYDSDMIIYIIKNQKNMNERIMVCDKDRINDKVWKQTYALQDLNGYEEVEYKEN